MQNASKYKIVLLTNLYPLPFEPRRGMFNKQQFDRLGQRHDLLILVPIPIIVWIKKILTRQLTSGEQNTVYFAQLYLPKIGKRVNVALMYLSLLLQCSSLLLRFRPDLIFASWAFPEGVVGVWLAKLLRRPCVIKVHGSDVNELMLDGSRRRQIVRAMSRASVVVCVSAALVRKLSDYGVDESKLLRIYNGVDRSIFHAASDSKDMSPVLLYVGNIKKSKGVFDLLEAYSKNLSHFPRLTLRIIGGGRDAKELEKKISTLGDNINVVLLGVKNSEEIADEMRLASLLLLPSYNEGVPNVLLEAKACALPVVATDVGGIPEIVREGIDGYLVASGDTASLVAVVERALKQDWDRAEISQGAEKFSWENNILELDRCVREVIEQHSNQARRA